MRIDLKDALPGDLVGFEKHGFFDVFIRFGQRRVLVGWPRAIASYLPGLRKRWAEELALANITHIAILSEYVPNVPSDRGNSRNWRAIQAARRVDEDFVDNIAGGRPFCVFQLPQGLHREAVIEQAVEYLGSEYGVLSILSIAFRLIIPFKFSFRDSRTVICSALGAICVQTGGYVHRWGDIYDVMPLQIAQLFGHK